MKEYGCGQLMADGGKCTSAGDKPCLCDVCQLKLIYELENCKTLTDGVSENLLNATPKQEKL